jgi:uncharacterized protein with NRDE domain
MCTVTFLPLSSTNFILTSNRDEQKERETLAPKKYIEEGIEMVFPKDKISGGTWIGTSSNNRLVCVLNGAFKAHKRKASYRVSRGLISKDVLKTKNLAAYIEAIDLVQVEPFTMVIVDWSDSILKLYELVWDESQKYFNRLENKPNIWSSSTLYSSDVKEIRKKWFKDWVDQNEFTTAQILKFHHSKKGDSEQAVFMSRSYVETVSITSVKKENGEKIIQYEDIVHSKKSTLNF